MGDPFRKKNVWGGKVAACDPQAGLRKGTLLHAFRESVRGARLPKEFRQPWATPLNYYPYSRCGFHNFCAKGPGTHLLVHLCKRTNPTFASLEEIPWKGGLLWGSHSICSGITRDRHVQGPNPTFGPTRLQSPPMALFDA